MTLPSASTGAVSTSGTSVTKCGLPMETAVPRTFTFFPWKSTSISSFRHSAPGQSMGMRFVSAMGSPISTVASRTFPSTTFILIVLIPDRVSRVISVLSVSPLS